MDICKYCINNIDIKLNNSYRCVYGFKLGKESCSNFDSGNMYDNRDDKKDKWIGEKYEK